MQSERRISIIKIDRKLSAAGILQYVMLISCAVLSAAPGVHAQDLSGHVNLIHNYSETYEDGQKTSDADQISHNGTLDYTRSLTNAISYRLYLRESISDTKTSDAAGDITKTHKRAVEPSADIFLRNPMYSFSTGYRREEEWSARISNEGRESTVFYYARFDVTPRALPSLTLDFDRKEEFDYLAPQTLDKSNDDYSISSAYQLPSDEVKMRYYLNYSHNIAKDEVSITEKTIIDSFNASYSAGYSDFLWNRKLSYTVGYQGNYTRSKTRQFVRQTGSILNERTVLGGFYIQNINYQVALNPLASLADENFVNSTGININTGTDHQLGVSVSSSDSVDRLYIYVDRNISGESNLNSTANWVVLRSSFNALNTWSPVSISSVTITTDIPGNMFKYEIEFTSPQNASFFKAINTATSSILNAQVTEIEAYGTDQLPTAEIKNVDTSFVQGVDLQVNVLPLEDLSIALSYSLDRSDQNPISVGNSFVGVFQNLGSNSISGERTNFRSQVTRNYGITSSWFTHDLLTTTVSFQKNENFDNMEQNDFESDTYRLMFNSIPLPTLDTTLSFIRSESFSFGEKSTRNDSILLSAGAELYEDLHMSTDIGYTRSKALTSGATSRTHLANVSFDARITRKLSGTVSYIYNRRLSSGEVTNLHESIFIVSYRPGQFINLTGNVRYADSAGDVTISEGVAADWLPLPAVKFNITYDHRDSEPDPSRSDALSGMLIWYLTKFADLRFVYTHTLSVEATKTESYNYNTSLNCRF